MLNCLASTAAVAGAKAFGALGGLALAGGGALGALTSAFCAIVVGKVAGDCGQDFLKRRKLQHQFEEALELLFDEDPDLWRAEEVDWDKLRKAYILVLLSYSWIRLIDHVS